MSEETSDSDSQDIQEHNETVRALSAGLLQIYEPKLKEVKDNLKELINKQNDLQIAMTSEKNAFSSRPIQEVNEMRHIMPLIVITGLPRSGKTTRAKELEKYFTDNGKGPVHIVSEADCIVRSGYGVKESFTDVTKEKQIRASLKSEAMKLLTKTSLVILDGTNYIKGYRYEIFCTSKNARTTQCTLHCAMTVEQRSSRRNEITQNATTSGSDLDVDTFDALCQRYEEPQDSSRWDRPLFTVYGDEELNLSQINSALYDQAPLPPNLATQNMPLSATNFLFELDKTTQSIVDQIAAARKIGLDGPVEIPQAGMRAEVPSNMSVAQLNRHRRQFLNYVKMHTNISSDISKIPAIFVLKTKAYKDKVSRIKMQMHQIHQRTKNLRTKALEIQELKVNQCATKLQQLHYEESLVANSKRTPRKS
uniref:Protein KTI12 homolog n=1 Tax=Anopheles minimus TaxID=112268 RepID=A0A182WAH2_9DIPT